MGLWCPVWNVFILPWFKKIKTMIDNSSNQPSSCVSWRPVTLLAGWVVACAVGDEYQRSWTALLQWVVAAAAAWLQQGCALHFSSACQAGLTCAVPSASLILFLPHSSGCAALQRVLARAPAENFGVYLAAVPSFWTCLPVIWRCLAVLWMAVGCVPVTLSASLQQWG